MDKEVNSSHLTITKQIEKLKNEKQLQIDDDNFASNYLTIVSYYRIMSYRFPFVDTNNKELFLPDNNFDSLVNLYEIDIEYKASLSIILQYIEIAFKTQIIYHFSERDYKFYINNKSYDFTDADKQFHNNKRNKDKSPPSKSFLTSIKREIKNINNVHIAYYQEQHDKNNRCGKLYKSKYCKCIPNAWIAIEALSFGDIINIYKYHNDQAKKVDICKYFSIDKSNTFMNLMTEIKRLRNIIAHHDKIIDRYSFIKTENIKFLRSTFSEINEETFRKYESNYLPYFLVIKHFMDILIKCNYKNTKMLDNYKKFLNLSRDYKVHLSLDILEEKYFRL